MNYGRGLYQIREAVNLDTNKFAELIGKTPGFVFKIEENCEDITKEEANSVCLHLQIPIEAYYFLCTEASDVPNQEKRYLYEMLHQNIKEVLLACVWTIHECDTLPGEKMKLIKEKSDELAEKLRFIIDIND